MPEPKPIHTQLDSARIAKLMEVIGRCVMTYQRIETCLKVLLPHMIPPGTEPSDLPVDTWRSLLDSKITLGPLVQQFRDSINSTNPDGFAKYLEQLVAQRNQLVHHFLTQPVGQVNSTADLDKAIEHVRWLMTFATPFERALLEAIRGFAVAVEKSILDEESVSGSLNLTEPSNDVSEPCK